MKTIAVYCTNTVKYMIREKHRVSFDDKVTVNGITTGLQNIYKQQCITYFLNCRQDTNKFSCTKP